MPGGRSLSASCPPRSSSCPSRHEGQYWPDRGTFAIDGPVDRLEWASTVHDYSEAQLHAARKWPVPINSPYTSLPEWARGGPVYDLAARITAGHETPYAQVQAIADYLRANYTYAFANDVDHLKAPEITDPVERFLFVELEGTCGTFSSAFVILARAIGIPARVVSGWAIGATPVSQTVYTDQAHQWAEVAFERLGWVTFEPTPAGPPSRAAEEAPPIGDQEKLEEALQSLEESGAEVVRLENGGAAGDAGRRRRPGRAGRRWRWGRWRRWCIVAPWNDNSAVRWDS